MSCHLAPSAVLHRLGPRGAREERETRGGGMAMPSAHCSPCRSGAEEGAEQGSGQWVRAG